MAISRSRRFEVFKRDSFKCQYCGAAAPDVLLEADHIKPLAAGGTDELLNLITSCEACNRGKAARELDDNSAVTKQRTQLEKLQERREQLEMMMEWSQGLRDVEQQGFEWVYDHWRSLAPGWDLSDQGKKNLRRWCRQFTPPEIVAAMDRAADSYLQFTQDGTVTKESWELAYSKIPGIARVERETKDDPDAREIYRLRGILRNRVAYIQPRDAINLIRHARSVGADWDEIAGVCYAARSWTNFQNRIIDLIDWCKKNR